jgi:membrane fusion protein (multidrug efflux system)
MIRKELTCCLLAATAGMMLSCSDDKKKAHDAVEYRTMVVSQKDMTLNQQYSARLTGRQIVEIRPQVSGTITRICTGEGMAVKRGQTLFVIDQTPFQAALEVAIANRKSAEAKLSTARMTRLSSSVSCIPFIPFISFVPFAIFMWQS